MHKQVLEDSGSKESRHHHAECCPQIPELQRLQYFYGQMLTSADLQEEQRYFREKLRLLNRCVHGYGVLCGLEVVPEPGSEPCDPEIDRRRERVDREREAREKAIEELKEQLESAETEEERRRFREELRQAEGEREEIERELDALCHSGEEAPPPPRVEIRCGVGVDCHGDEIILRRSRTIDPLDYLDPDEARRFREGHRRPLWVSICFCEMPVEPVRPVYVDSCQPADSCRYARVQDSYRIKVTLEPPATDGRCEPCCCPCSDPCLVLARIDPFTPTRPIPPAAVHNEVRRRFGLYDWVTITGISWVHGGHYTSDQAAALLGKEGHGDGLEFRFSRPVRAETLREGVIDVRVVEGGRGRSGGIYNVPGKIHHPPGRLVDRVFFRQRSDDKFHDGDLVRIRLRADFVLDACCRPVDGNHVGGLVPLLPGALSAHPHPPLNECARRPGWDGPWTSGNGIGGGHFESWIGIRDPESRPDYKGEVK